MRSFSIYLLVFVCLVGWSGCSSVAEDSEDSNVSTAEPQVAVTAPTEYTDANAALADGIRELDNGNTERAIELLDRAVELNPDLADAHFRLGIAHSLIEFRDELAAKQSTDPTPPPGDGNKKPDETKPRSVLAFERAVKAYNKLIDADKENHAAFYNLGRSYNKLNKDEDAAKALRQAVRLNPEDTEYQTELGSILMKLAKYAEAETALKKAIELDENNIEAFDMLERAEAGRKRVSFTVLPKDPTKPDASTDSNTSSTSEPDKPEPKPTTKPDVKPPVKPAPSPPQKPEKP